MHRKISRRDMLMMGAASVAGVGLYKGLEMAGFSPLRASGAGSSKNGDFISESLGRYIFLTPQKLGGGTHAVDLETNKTLAWISYWNYGDSCPISHHLAAFPANNGKDPYDGFEFVNSTQGGDNVLMYGIPTRIKEYGLLDRYGQGNHIYRVEYNGKTKQMELLEDISETTGIGLGVHTCIFPDGEGFACADGQKDVAAFFTRARGPKETTKVLAAFRADWKSESPHLGDCWLSGGTVTLQRLSASKDLGVYDYAGTKRNKINYEMAPMAELLVERGQIPGDSPQTLTGLDFALHDPRDDVSFSLMGLRMCGGAIVVDRKDWNPICFLSANEHADAVTPLKRISRSPETWEFKIPKVHNPIHETGFNPAGNHLVMMNNLRANNVAVFDVKNSNPLKWKRRTKPVRHDTWVGEYPSPFHVCFSTDGQWCYFTVLEQKPAKSHIFIVSTKDWEVKHIHPNVGVDTQTLHVTYDGKYVLCIFSGFQRLESGVFVFKQQPPWDPVGYAPNFGGHHDCVVVPSNPDELKWSRCCTV